MIIFDLDGTLADCEHRRRFVDINKNRCPSCKPPFASRIDSEGLPCPDCGFNASRWRPDWKAFYNACDKDKPIRPTLEILYSLYREYRCPINNIQLKEIHIWSGRCESTRAKTNYWLIKNGVPLEIAQNLKMRPEGDSTPDDELKSMWLDELIAHSCKTIDFVFDDRPKVVRMWRRRGIFVFNCNQNDEEF